MFNEALPALTGEEERGGVEGDEIQPLKRSWQLAKALILGPVLDAPGIADLRGIIVEFLRRLGHRAVEMLELASVVDQTALTSLECAPLRPGDHDPRP